jgi:hypothetical protein
MGALSSGAAFRLLTFGQLGAYPERANTRAYDDAGPVNRLLLSAHEQADLCGLKVEATHLAWTGGATYLHRPAPLYPHNGPGRETHRFNYAVTAEGWAQGGEVVAKEAGLALVRFPWACTPDPGYPWRLP